MAQYKCYIHYADGLTKKLNLSQKEFDETFDVWKDEMDNEFGEDELVYMKIRKIKTQPNATKGMQK